MSDSLLRILGSVIAVLQLCTRASVSLPCAPPSDAEWRRSNSSVRAALEDGNLEEATKAATALHTRCQVSLGEGHPETREVAAHVRLYQHLGGFDHQTKDAFLKAITQQNRAWGRIPDFVGDVLPDSDSLRQLLRALRTSRKGISSPFPLIRAYRANCDFGTARAITCTRDFECSRRLLELALEGYRTEDGFGPHAKLVELALAEILRELQLEPTRQLTLLKGNIAFAEENQVTGRLLWRGERTMTLLAEAYYRHGNQQEANRLYAEVRSLLPEETKHELVGWCKSWCDRHEARQLMEKGDWDGAYEKILQARVGTIDYGHRNLSKGLTMERILRMSAQIQRKRGNNKEADEDQEYADRIARHAAKLRVAVEAELKKLRESEANTTPQPLPAPSP